MSLSKTDFKNLVIINQKKFYDNRGFFTENFKIYELEELLGYKVNFIQENLVSSKRNVLRGLHFQKEPYSQSKLITVLKGEIFDVVIDLRKKSKTYLKYFSINLSEECNMSLFIPKGFAHGYLTVSEYALVSYKVDNVYSPESEMGIRYNEEKFNINWGIDSKEIIVSEKDKNLNFKIHE